MDIHDEFGVPNLRRCKMTGRLVGRVAVAVMVAAAVFAVGYGCGSENGRQRADLSAARAHSAAAMDVLAGDYGPNRGELTDREFGALIGVYAVAERTGQPCFGYAAELIATRDYRGHMAGCLGAEDSDAVAVLLGQVI